MSISSQSNTNNSSSDTWRELTTMAQNREPMKIKVSMVNSGGCVCNYIGVSAFIPNSHLCDRPESPSKLIGQTLTVVPYEVDPDNTRLVLSEREARRDEHFASLEVGNSVSGKFTSRKDFGLFFDLGHGVHGLLHRSSMPADFGPEVGESVDVLITSKEGGRIALALDEQPTTKPEAASTTNSAPPIPMPATTSAPITREDLLSQLLDARQKLAEKDNKIEQLQNIPKRTRTTKSVTVWETENYTLKFTSKKNKSVNNATVTSVAYRFKECFSKLEDIFEPDSQEIIDIANRFNNWFLEDVEPFIPTQEYTQLMEKSISLITRPGKKYKVNGKTVEKPQYNEKDKTKINLEWTSFSIPYIRFAYKYREHITINDSLMEYFYQLQEVCSSL